MVLVGANPTPPAEAPFRVIRNLIFLSVSRAVSLIGKATRLHREDWEFDSLTALARGLRTFFG